MASRSKFERQLSPGLRQIGFSIKIPDAGRGLKPFDYVVGIRTIAGGQDFLRFVAIEAKSVQYGWTLNRASWRSHQRTALDIIDSMSPRAAWVAVGFLGIPVMKRDHNNRKIEKPRRAEAYLLPWSDYKFLEGEKSIWYGDIITCIDSRLEWEKVGSRYAWTIPPTHSLYVQQTV
jgi:hypothetical protein